MKNERLKNFKETKIGYSEAKPNATNAHGSTSRTRKKFAGVFMLLLSLLFFVSAAFVSLLYNNVSKTGGESASSGSSLNHSADAALAAGTWEDEVPTVTVNMRASQGIYRYYTHAYFASGAATAEPYATYTLTQGTEEYIWSSYYGIGSSYPCYAAGGVLLSVDIEVPAYTRYNVDLNLRNYVYQGSYNTNGNRGFYGTIFSCGTDPSAVVGAYYGAGADPADQYLTHFYGVAYSWHTGDGQCNDSRIYTFDNPTGETKTVSRWYVFTAYNTECPSSLSAYAYITLNDISATRLIPTTIETEYNRNTQSLQELWRDVVNYPTAGITNGAYSNGGWNGANNCIEPGTYKTTVTIPDTDAYSNYIFYEPNYDKVSLLRDPVLANPGTPITQPVTKPVLDEEGNPTYDEEGNPITEEVQVPVKTYEVTIVIRPKKLDLTTLVWDYDEEAPPQFNYEYQLMHLDETAPEWLIPHYAATPNFETDDPDDLRHLGEAYKTDDGKVLNAGNYTSYVWFTLNETYVKNYLGSNYSNWQQYFVVPDYQSEEEHTNGDTYYCDDDTVEDWTVLDWILAPKRVVAEWNTTDTTAEYGSHNNASDVPFIIGDKLATDSSKYTFVFGSNMPAVNEDIAGKIVYEFYENQYLTGVFYTLDEMFEKRVNLTLDPTTYYVKAYLDPEYAGEAYNASGYSAKATNFVLCKAATKQDEEGNEIPYVYLYSERANYEYYQEPAANYLSQSMVLNANEDSYTYRWTQTVMKSVADGTQETFVLDQGDWVAEYFTPLASPWGRAFNGTLATYSAEYFNERGYIFYNGSNYGGLFVPVGADIIFDLNGNVLDRDLPDCPYAGYVIRVHGTLTVKDSKAEAAGGNKPVFDENGKLTFTEDDSAHPTFITDEEGNRIKTVVTGTGKITGGYTYGGGGGVDVRPGGTFNFQSGIIQGNNSGGNVHWAAGGVYVEGSAADPAYFNMTGGIIADNYNGASGGYYVGGGIFSYYANISITGGYILHNYLYNSTTGYSAGGIGLYIPATVEIKNVQILENAGISGGITVYAEDGYTDTTKPITLNNVTIKGNHNTYSPLAGAGYFTGANYTFEFEDCVISDNALNPVSGYASANYYDRAGGLYLNGGSFKLKNTLITNNFSHYGSGGVTVWSSASATFDNVIIAENIIASSYYGSVYPAAGLLAYGTTVNMTNSHIGRVSAADNGINGVAYEGNSTFRYNEDGTLWYSIGAFTGVSLHGSTFSLENGSMSGNKGMENSNGVMFCYDGACTVTLKHVDVADNDSGEGSGQMFHLCGYAHTVNFEDVNVTGNKAAGGIILLGHGTSLIWNGGSLSGNTDYGSDYGILCIGYSNVAATAELYDVDITDNTAVGFMTVYVNYVAGSSLVMEGGSISGNTSTHSNGAGAIYVSGSNATHHGVVRLTDVDIVGNAGTAVGGVYVYQYAEFSMTGGTVKNNTASNTGGNVGGIWSANYTTVSLENVVVQGNVAEEASGYSTGGILAQGSLSLNRVTVGTAYSSNAETAANKGEYGGVLLFNPPAGTLSLAGTVIIKNNTSLWGTNGEFDNLYLKSNTKIKIEGNLTNSEILIGTPMIGVFTEGFGANNPSGLLPTDVFFSDGDFGDADHSPIYLIKNTDDTPVEGIIMGNDNASRWTYAVQTSLAHPTALNDGSGRYIGSQETFKLLGDWNADANGWFNGTIAATEANGYYPYSGSLEVPVVTNSEGQLVEANIILDLNGYKLNRGGDIETGTWGPWNSSYNGFIIFVVGHLKIVDSSMEYEYKNGQVVLDENGDPVYRAPYIDEDGNVVPNGTGTITGAYACYQSHGAILVGGGDGSHYSTLDVQGGNFINNASTGNYGGIIAASYYSSVNIKNAYFTKNYVSGSCSSTIMKWFTSEGDSVTIDRCLFLDNANSYAMVCGYDCNLTITNTEMRITEGSGIYTYGIDYRSYSWIDDTLFTAENVRLNGGSQGIWIYSGNAELTNVTVENSTSNGVLGLGQSGYTANVHATGVELINNTWGYTYDGAGVYYAAVSMYPNCTLEMDTYVDPKTGEKKTCKINGNTNTYGGVTGVYVGSGATFKMTEGEISHNHAPNTSNILCGSGTIELTDVDIEDNVSGYHTVDFFGGAVATFDNVNIKENEVLSGYVVVWVYNSSTLTMKRGCISGNTMNSAIQNYGVLTIGYSTYAATHAELYGVTIDGNQGGWSTVFVNNNGDSLLMDDYTDPATHKVTHTSVTNNTASVADSVTIFIGGGSSSTYGSLELNNAVIDGNTADYCAGIQLANYAHFSMSGGSVSNNRGSDAVGLVIGKNVNSHDGSIVTLNDVKINGNAGSGTTVVYGSTGGIATFTNLELFNCEITENKGTYYGAIWGGTGVDIRIEYSLISDNEGVKFGGIYSQATLNLYQTTVSNNTATGSLASGDKGAAGGIFVNSGLLGLSTGVEISGNTCTIPESAGGIYTKGEVRADGANIVGNMATGSASAGGVYVFGSSSAKLFLCNNSTITLNFARAADPANNIKMGAGGVYVAGSAPTAGTLELKDSVVIDSNTLVNGDGASVENSNVYVVDAENNMIQVVGSFLLGASVGVYRLPIGVFTEGFGLHNYHILAESIFHSDSVLSEVKSYDTVLEQVVSTPGLDVEGFTVSYDNAINWAYLVKLSLATGTQQTFVLYGDWVASETISNTTTFGTDVKAYFNGALYVPVGANMVIELNGSKIDRNLYNPNGGGASDAGRDSGYVITVAGELTIRDNHRTDSSLIRHGINDPENGVIYNGAITGGNNSTKNRAGGIYVAQNATLTMYDGRIEHNRGSGSAPVAGGVYVDGTFDMYGGAIDDNYGDSAGGVYVSASGTYTVFSGEVKNNTSVSSTSASGIGGVRVVNGGVMYFGDGVTPLGTIEITDNKLSTGVNSNLKSEDESYLFQVNGKFGAGTSIGITRGMSGAFTEGYGQYHLNSDGTAINPTTYFFSDDEDHFVTKEGTGAATEAVILGYNNKDNWTYAVETSLAFNGATQTFILYSDWTAERPSSTNYTTEFGSNTNAYYRGALYVPYGASIILELKGHTLSRDLSSNEIRADGFVIYVMGELIIRDNPDSDDATADVGTITGGASKNLAGGIVVGNGGEVYLEGGEISGNIANFAAGSAGGVYVYGSQDTHFVMTGGEITNNRGYDAGGVYVDNGLSGDRNGTFTMTGGSITKNTAVSSNIGGVRVNTTGILELGGDAVIKDNSNAQVTDASNLYLMYASNSGNFASVPPNIQVVSGFTGDADIHITRETIGQFTDNFELSGTTLKPEDVFTSDNPDYFVDEIEIEIDNGDGTTTKTHEAFMKCHLPAVNWSYAVQTSLTTGTTQTFTVEDSNWVASISASDGTSFGKGVGYEQGRLWVPVGASIILDLNGYTIDRALTNPVQNGEVFFIQGELKIIDSSTAQTGKITGGYSTGTGGIYNSGKLTVEAGAITGNRSTAITNGAGIYNSGTLTMTGGSVTGNTGYRAGIYQDATGVLNIGGSVKIDGNFYETVDEGGNTVQTPSNLYFKDTTALINVVKPFTSGAKIALTREGLGLLTTGYGKYNTVNPETYFVSDSPNNVYEISHIGEGNFLEAIIMSRDNATNWTHAVKTSLANQGAPQTFTLYSNWTPDSNHSFGDDVGYLYGGLNVPVGANIILDLNGYSIDRQLTSAVQNGYVFDIAGKLQVIDSVGGGEITGGYSTNTAGGIHIEESGWVDFMKGGLAGNVTESSTSGGAVTVEGKFTMTGGTIIGNDGGNCGGIYVSTPGTFELGGYVEILDNFPDGMVGPAFGDAADIYLESPTGMITFVSAFSSREVLYVYRDAIGPFTTGYSAFAADVTFSTAAGDPYFVEATTNGMELQLTTHDNRRNWEYAVQTSLDTGTTQEFKLWEDWNAEDGVFGTEAPYYLNGALNVPVGASISFNQNGYALNRGLETAKANGYVMYVSGELILDDFSSAQTGVFTGGNNSSASSAGGVYVNKDATFTMNGGKISANNVYGAGGGGVYNNGTFTLKGGVIGAFEQDEVSYEGNRGLAGGVFNGPYGTFVMSGGSINANESTNNAGGVYVYNGIDSSFTMTGGRITNNSAEDAGGIYAAGKFDMRGGEISGNTAKGTDVTKGGGSGVYVSSTGIFTMTGGVVKENVGVNGVRVYSSGVINLGGSAQVYNNKNTAVYDSTDPHEYRNIYLTIGTQFINIVEKFEEGAFIGVTRDASGIFTANYGTYNPTASPANYFVSDKEAYAVSSAQSDITGTIEAVIGSPVSKPSKTESPVYDGEWHTILTDFDSKHMSYGPLPNGVIYDEDEGAFKAKNAGEYTVDFELKDGFCWPDGTNGKISLTAKVLPRVAELEWSHLNDLVYNTREQTPTAIVTNLVPGDVCTVGVTGGQIHAGSYTATASFLSNPNYTLDNANDLEKGFTIAKAKITVEILNDTAAYKTPEELKLRANISNDGITFITIDNSYVTYSVDNTSLVDMSDLASGILTALSSTGTVYITATVEETQDTLAATSDPKEITLTKATPKLALDEATVEYGTDLNLVVMGHEELASANMTLTLENGTGKAVLNGTTLTPVNAGKVKITISTDETANYFANTVTVTVTITPKVLEIEWDGPFEFNYDGLVHGPDAHATNLVPGDECKIIVGGKQTDAGEYLGENGAQALLTSNPNYTLEGTVNVFHDFTIHKVDLPIDDKVSLVKNTVDYGDVLTLAITGNKENAEVLYEIVDPEVINPSWTYGDAEIYYAVDGEGNKLYNAEDRTDPFKAFFEPTGDVGYVLVKVTIGESENYKGGVYYEYVLIKKAPLDATFYTDAELELREVIYGDENCELEVVGNPENGQVDFTVLGGTGAVSIVGDVLKALKVGEVNVQMHIAATEHYDEIFVSEIITVKPRPVTLSWTSGTFIYDGQEQAPVATVANAAFGDVLKVVVTGAVNAGNHTAVAIGLTGPSSSNYTLDEEEGALVITTPFVIQPRKIDGITWGNKELLFNGEYQAPSYTLDGLILGETCELVIEDMGKHVGTYTATAVGTKNPNYYVDSTTANRTVTYEIVKAPITLAILNEYALYYNEVQIDLAGNIGNGAVTYTITTNPTGIATVSTDGVIFADGYGYITITVDVAATNDTYAGTVTKTIPVVKGEASLDFEDTDVIYGDTLSLVFASKWHPADVSFELVNGTDEAGTGLAEFDVINHILTATGAGEVKMILRTKETDKYLATTKEITITIHKRILTLDWQDTFTYDGTAKLPVAENIGNLAFDDEAPEITVEGAQINAGSYTATVTDISNPNYALLVDEENGINGYSVPFVIEKADLELEVLPDEIFIDEENVPVEILNNLSGHDYTLQLVDSTGSAHLIMIDGEGNLFYVTTSAAGNNGNFFITPTAVGDVVLIVNIQGSDNYNPVTNKQFTIKISRLEPEIDLKTTEFYYGDTLELSVVGEGTEDRPVTYTVTNGTGSATLSDPTHLLGTGVGTVTVTVTLAQTSIYEEQTFEVTVTVKKRPVALSWTVGTYVYDGTEQAPTATVTNTVFGDTVNVTVQGNVNAGTGLVATAIAVDNPNYTIVDGTNITINYTIERKIVEVDWDASTLSFVYDGQSHVPTATVKAGFLISGDSCDVYVSGAQTDAYGAWPAVVSGLSNPNYAVDPDDPNSSTTFEILTATPEVTLDPVVVRYHELSDLSVTCTPTGGNVTYTIIAGNANAQIQNGNQVYGTELGKFTLEIHVDSTTGCMGVLNTNEKTITVELEVIKGWQPYELLDNTVVYGSTLTLDLTGFDETADYRFLGIVRINGDDGDATLSGNVLTPVHVGKVKVKVEYDETAHYEKTVRELEVTITPYVLEFTWDNDPADEKLVFTYNGTEQAPKAIPDKLFGEDKCEILVHGARNAGSWTATAYDTSNPNYTIVGSQSMIDHPTQDFVIEKLVVIVEWNDTTLEYNGEPQTPTANIANKFMGDGNYGEDDVSFVYDGHQTELGYYTDDEKAKIVGLTGADSGNYTLEGVDGELLETDFEIVKGHLNLVLSTSSTSISYLQSVVVTLTGKVGDGEVTYEVVSGSGTFNIADDGTVTFTPGGAGYVTIQAHVDETEKTYAADSNTVTIWVGKAYWAAGVSYEAYYGTPAALTWTPGVYPGLSISNYPDSDRFGSWISYSTFVGYGVGSYQIYVHWGENANFYGGSCYRSIYVQRKPLTIDWDTLEFTYNGNVQSPKVTTHTQVAAKGDDFPVYFTGTGIDAGSYVATAVGLGGSVQGRYGGKYSGDTYYVLVGDNLASSYTIGRAEIDPKITTTDAEYGVPLQLLVSGNLGEGAVRYEILPGGTGSATINGDILNPTALGTVIVKAYIEETKNYHAGECTAIVTIGKKIPQLNLETNTVVYGDTLHLNVTGNEENGQIMFSVVDGTGSATITPTSGILTPVSVGTVKVIISITETTNYRAFTVEREVTITPRLVQIEWDEDTLEFEYDGTLKTPVANVVSGLVDGDTTEINVLGGKINAGVYTATADSCSNPNYMLDPAAENLETEFVITPLVVEIRIDQTEAYLGVPVTLTVTSNLPIDQSKVKYTVTAAGGNATLNGNVITGTQYGQVIVTATLPASTNYQAATDMRIFEIKKFVPNIGFANNEVVYGSTLDLVVTGNLGEGAVSIDLAHKSGDTGLASLSGTKLRGLGVGVVTLKVTIGATLNYEGGDFEVEVNVVPRPVILVWGGNDQKFEFEYNGEEQYPEARVYNVLPGDVCNVTLIEGAIDAGNRFAKALELDNKNYTLVNGTNVDEIPFTITKRVAQIEWEEEDFTYNGQMQAPTAKISNPVPADEGKLIQVVVSGETHATKTWDGEVAVATATMISNPNYTLVGCDDLTTTYVIDQLEADLVWDDPCEVDYNGSQAALPGAIVGNKAKESDECDVLVREYVPPQTFAMFAAASPFSGSLSNTRIAEAYAFEGANEDDYKLPEDNLKEFIENAKEITVVWDDLELVYNGEEQYPTYALNGILAGDQVMLEFTCDEKPIDVKYASDNVTIAPYTAKLKLVGKDASHYAISILQQKPDAQGNLQATVDFKITPRPVTVYATSKDVQLLLELGEDGKFVLDKFATKDWKDWFFLTCNELVGKDIGADVNDIFDAENLFLTPAFYRITRDEQGNIVSISDERVIPGQEGPDIELGEYKIGIIIENLTKLNCLTGNYVAEVELSEDYGILTIVRDDAVLKLDVIKSNYQFLYLEEDGEEIYRRAYAELGWTHGEDDANFERVVLGQVLPETTADMFLANIHESQIKNLRIYDSEGTLIYDCGLMIDSDVYIGTGSKVELMLGGEVIDEVYISVLGDIDGDGMISTMDSAMVNKYIVAAPDERTTIEEIVLAMLLENGGDVSTMDSAAVNKVNAGRALIEDYFYKEEQN